MEEVITDNKINTLYIKESSQGFLQDILRKKMYVNPLLAAVREPILNARDANIKAGRSYNDIEIHIPVYEEYYLSVKDKGIGMSEETINEVYLSLGVSNSRHDNNTVGKWGLGALAPNCISSNFTVETSWEGIRSKYLVFITEQGVNAVTLLSKRPSTEVGTEVRIDLPKLTKQELDQYLTIINKVVGLWEDKPTVNVPLFDMVIVKKPTWGLIHKPISFNKSFYVEEGGCIYEIEPVALLLALRHTNNEEKYINIINNIINIGNRSTMNSTSIYVKVDINELVTSPQRETLDLYNKNNLNCITKALDRIYLDVEDEILNLLNKATTVFETVKAFSSFNQFIVKEWTINGITISNKGSYIGDIPIHTIRKVDKLKSKYTSYRLLISPDILYIVNNLDKPIYNLKKIIDSYNHHKDFKEVCVFHIPDSKESIEKNYPILSTKHIHVVYTSELIKRNISNRKNPDILKKRVLSVYTCKFNDYRINFFNRLNSIKINVNSKEKSKAYYYLLEVSKENIVGVERNKYITPYIISYLQENLDAPVYGINIKYKDLAIHLGWQNIEDPLLSIQNKIKIRLEKEVKKLNSILNTDQITENMVVSLLKGDYSSFKLDCLLLAIEECPYLLKNKATKNLKEFFDHIKFLLDGNLLEEISLLFMNEFIPDSFSFIDETIQELINTEYPFFLYEPNSYNYSFLVKEYYSLMNKFEKLKQLKGTYV